MVTCSPSASNSKHHTLTSASASSLFSRFTITTLSPNREANLQIPNYLGQMEEDFPFSYYLFFRYEARNFGYVFLWGISNRRELRVYVWIESHRGVLPELELSTSALGADTESLVNTLFIFEVWSEINFWATRIQYSQANFEINSCWEIYLVIHYLIIITINKCR